MKDQRYVLVKGSSGLGNRILAAASAILYGQITDRKIIIDWSEGSYSEDEMNVFLLYFKNDNLASLDDLEEIKSIYPKMWENNLDKSFGGLKQQLNLKGYPDMSFNISKLDYDQDILVFCAYSSKVHAMRRLFKDKFSYLNTMTNPQILAKIIRENFELQPDIRSRIDNFKAKNFGKNTIGVHIRYSDMKIPLDEIYQKVKQVVQQNKQATIFLATDSKEVSENFQNTYEKVVKTDKWFSPSGERLHQNWTQCPDRIENGKQALIDLYLLSECDSLIFSSQSSFGYVASLLSDSKKLYDIKESSNLIDKVVKKILQ